MLTKLCVGYMHSQEAKIKHISGKAHDETNTRWPIEIRKRKIIITKIKSQSKSSFRCTFPIWHISCESGHAQNATHTHTLYVAFFTSNQFADYPLCMQTFKAYETHSLLFHFRIHDHWIIFHRIVFGQTPMKSSNALKRPTICEAVKTAEKWNKIGRNSKNEREQAAPKRKIQLYLLLLSTECKNIIECIALTALTQNPYTSQRIAM